MNQLSKFLTIIFSPPKYHDWHFPVSLEVPDIANIDFSNSYVLTFAIKKKIKDTHPSLMKFKAPLHSITFGDLFDLYLLEYNDHNKDSPIEYADRYNSYGWSFYVESQHWLWQVKRFINPFLSVFENKLADNDLIVVVRGDPVKLTSLISQQTHTHILKLRKEAEEKYLSEIKRQGGSIFSPIKYRAWHFPFSLEMPNLDLIDFSNSCILTFEVKKKIGESEFTYLKFRAPLNNITFGELFNIYIFEYNEKNRENKIEYADRQYSYGWSFYVKPQHWWQVKRYINPFLSVFENKLKASDLIVVVRGEPVKLTALISQQTPTHILKQGKEAEEKYLSEVKKQGGATEYLFEAKILVIGEGGSGKTTFVRKMQDSSAPMPVAKDTTLGIAINNWTFPTGSTSNLASSNDKFYVNFWDFGGQKIYQGTHQIFFSEKSFYVLIADSREQVTDFSYWLNTVEMLGKEDSSLIIVLNKKYGHVHEFDETGYRNQFGKIIKEVVILDLSRDDSEIKTLQNKLKLHLLNLPGIGDALPSSWVSIREIIFNETEDYISFEKFRAICATNSITDPGTIEILSKYFHRLGVFTHYIDDEVLQDRIYLNSNWLVKTVYKILDHENSKTKQGKLSEQNIKEIWSDSALYYELKKLTQLMNKFGLMYQIPNSNKYIVPSHLPSEMPYKKWPYEDAGIHLQFVYEFDKYMPKGIMSNLIVALHHLIINHDLVWQRGLNLSLDGANAEIVESYGSSNQFLIRITGNNKTELLAIIRERFAIILRPFNRLNFKQLVPCVCTECIKSNNPAFHDYNLLQNFRLRGIEVSQCNKTGIFVNIEELLKITSYKGGTSNIPSIHSNQLKTIKIFLASSSELNDDRKEFEIFINRENKRLSELGLFLKLELWEDFIDAMSQSRLQDEYNRVIDNCDIFFSIFYTKVGRYTAEEFEKAFNQFKEKGKPLIYTYFKDAPVNINEISSKDIKSKADFERKLKLLGHFRSNYKNIDDLKYQFKSQLDKILPLN